MAYGIKIHSASGDTKIITPDDGTIIAADTVTMPNDLNSGDNTYGEDISLGGTYSEDEISVLVSPGRPVYNALYSRFVDGTTFYYNTFYLNSADTYYTRDDATGVMTAYTAGNKTTGSKSTYNPILSVFPVAFWDKMGETSFTNVRLFAATAYLFRDTHDDSNVSLAGTASSTGTVNLGTVSTINNNNDTDGAGTQSYVGTLETGGTSETYESYLIVTFATSVNLNQMDLIHGIYAESTIASGFADGWWEVDLYYGGAWHTIQANDWHDYVLYQSRTDTTTGYWSGVTKVRVWTRTVAQKGTGYSQASCWHMVREIKCWGNSYTNGQENKVCYSIGSEGVSSVDYMVATKRFT